MPKYRHKETKEEIVVSRVRITANGDKDLSGKYNLAEYEAIIDTKGSYNVTCVPNPNDKKGW
jgi:hypothetical protein